MMIKAIEVYLVTDGNGLEAVQFYQEVFEAKVISCTKFKDAGIEYAEEYANRLLNAQLDINGIRLQISDDHPESVYRSGTNMSACIVTDSIEATEKIYQKLKVAAQEVSLPLQATFWSPAYANLIDRFGMQWQINTELPLQ